MDWQISIVSFVVFVGVLGLVSEAVNLGQPCSKVDFDLDLADGKLTIENMGEVSSGGVVIGYENLDEDRFRMDKRSFSSLKPGNSIEVKIEGQAAVVRSEKCRSKEFEVRSQGLRLRNCLENKENPEGFKQCAGIN
jgi:hypothetical protein